MKKNNILLGVIKIVIFFSFVIVFIYGYIYIQKLEEQITHRDEIITSMQAADSMQLKKVEPLTESTSSTYTLDGVTVTPDQIIRYANQLNQENIILKDSLFYYKTFYDMSNSSVKSEFTVKTIDGGKRQFTFKSRSLPVDTVKTLLNQNQSTLNDLVNKLNNAYKDEARLKSKLDMYQDAIDQYGITFKIIKQDSVSTTYSIKAPKLDSALMLLPYYRKELKYDSKKNVWTIGIKKFF